MKITYHKNFLVFGIATARAINLATEIVQPIIRSPNHTASYLLPWGWTHRQTHAHTHFGVHTNVILGNQGRTWFKNGITTHYCNLVYLASIKSLEVHKY